MKDTTKLFAIFGAAAIVVVGSISASFAIQRHITEAQIQVESKERLMSVSSSDGNTKTEFKNFVYASGETYVVKDSFWNWHFRAGTVFAKIPDGQAICDVTLSGYRWGFVSMYQNIIEADCTNE